MSRKSSIERLPPVIKAAIAGLLKEGRHSLDEILQQIRAEFPDERLPSRSALGRYKQNFDELAKDLRETREIADVWAQKFGKEPDSDIGKVVLELLRTLSFRCSADFVNASNDEEGKGVQPKEIAQLARAMSYIENAGRLSLKREQELRTAIVQDVEKKLAGGPRKPDAESLELIRQAIRGEA